MKAALMAILTLMSISSFASVISCDIYNLSNEGDLTLLDSIFLGNTSDDEYLQESTKEIKGSEGKFINIVIDEVENKTFATVHIFQAGESFKRKKILTFKGSLEQILNLTSYENKISFSCMTKRPPLNSLLKLQ